MNFNTGSTYGYQYQSSSYKHVSSFSAVEKTTHTNSNSNRFIDGQRSQSSQCLPHNGPSFSSGSIMHSVPMQPPNFPQLGSDNCIDDLERSTNTDLNGDGFIGGQRSQPPQHLSHNGSSFRSGFNAYIAPMQPPSFIQVGSNDLINDLERSTNTDIDGDGLIGGQFMQQSNFHQSSSGNRINQLENALNIDCDRDGSIGGQFKQPPHFQPSPSGGQINQMKKRTHIDCHDGRPPPHIPNSQPYHNRTEIPVINYSAGGGFVNQVENRAHIDCHGGRPPPQIPNYQPYNNPIEPPVMNYSGGEGFVNQVDDRTHINFNGGRLPSQIPNYQPYNNLIEAPVINYSAGEGIMNEIEKSTHIDFNGDGRIGTSSSPIPNSQSYNDSSRHSHCHRSGGEG
ncbi:unnamed protein product, partial [Adineta steineri]